MRITKEAEERRAEILDAAEELFAKNGYALTSTNDIIERVGIARGTLYYHFRNKEEILDAVVLRFTENLIKRAEKAASDKSVMLYDRIALTMLSLSSDDELGRELLSQIHVSENALLHRKVQDIMIERCSSLFASLIEEGNVSGVFHCTYPYAAAEMIITYSYIAFDSARVINERKRESLILGFIDNVERLLGAESGSMRSVIFRIFGI
ncbi:MAG: TetR/AcrR family transcriptional regulator [Bullifex sp.]